MIVSARRTILSFVCWIKDKMGSRIQREEEVLRSSKSSLALLLLFGWVFVVNILICCFFFFFALFCFLIFTANLSKIIKFLGETLITIDSYGSIAT